MGYILPQLSAAPAGVAEGQKGRNPAATGSRPFAFLPMKTRRPVVPLQPNPPPYTPTTPNLTPPLACDSSLVILAPDQSRTDVHDCERGPHADDWHRAQVPSLLGPLVVRWGRW